MTNKRWNDKVRQQIKDAGQELINRADEFMPESAWLTSEININIKISSEFPAIPLITVSRLTPCDTTRIRLQEQKPEDPPGSL